MSLEDQIRAMGDARAASVSTPSWSDVSRGGRGRWLLAAAAAIVLVVGVVVVLSTDDGDDPSVDVDTADPAVGIDSEPPIRRWIPADGEIDTIEYGAFASLFTNSVGARHEVALITTLDDAADPQDLDWTTIDIKIPGLIGDDRELGPEISSGVTYMVLLRPESNEEVAIRSVRFSPEELEEVRADLIGIENIQVLASTIAALDDAIDVAYAGPAASHDRSLTGPGGTLAWTNTENPAQFFATFPQVASGSASVQEYFALVETEPITFDSDYFAWPDDPAPREIDVAEWNTLIENTVRESATTQLFYAQTSFAEAGPEFDVIGRATVSGGAEPTLELVMDEPFAIRDGGVIVSEFSGEAPTIRLIFGPLDPGVEYSTIRLAARLSATEARLFANRINASWSPVDDAPSPGPTCATNPEPSAEFLDTATHIAFDRTPLDLDLDGIDDEILVHEADDDTWSLIARLQRGWTNALDIGQPSLPGLALTPGGVPAGTDLDGDGGLEFFVTGYLAGTAELVSFNGCELVDEFLVDSPPGSPGATLGVQLDLPATDELCAEECFTRVSCAGGAVIQEILISALPDDGEDPSEPHFSWGRAQFSLRDGVITVNELPPADGRSLVDLPADAPSQETTGVIDCTPPGTEDVDISAPERPECAGNAAPAAEVERHAVMTGDGGELDIDQDGAIDTLFTYADATGNTWLMANLGGDNYTGAVRVNWDGYSTPPVHRPNLVATTSGELAAHDLTDNGSLEFFIDGFGNTGRSAGMVGLEDCRLRTFGPHSLDKSVEESFGVLIGVGGNSCAPTGCQPWTTCVDGQLVTELTTPRDGFDPDRPLSEVAVRWITTIYSYNDGDFVVESESEVVYSGDNPPAGTLDRLTDVIECTP